MVVSRLGQQVAGQFILQGVELFGYFGEAVFTFPISKHSLIFNREAIQRHVLGGYQDELFQVFFKSWQRGVGRGQSKNQIRRNVFKPGFSRQRDTIERL